MEIFDAPVDAAVMPLVSPSILPTPVPPHFRPSPMKTSRLRKK